MTWPQLRSDWVLTAFVAAGAGLTVSIWPLAIFPDSLIEGQGLTRFKIGAAYTICILLALAALLDWRLGCCSTGVCSTCFWPPSP